jgi:hypothetical protein
VQRRPIQGTLGPELVGQGRGAVEHRIEESCASSLAPDGEHPGPAAHEGLCAIKLLVWGRMGDLYNTIVASEFSAPCRGGASQKPCARVRLEGLSEAYALMTTQACGSSVLVLPFSPRFFRRTCESSIVSICGEGAPGKGATELGT